MKKKYLISLIVAMTILAAGAGIATTVMAADNTDNIPLIGKFFGKHGQAMNKLTDTQKAELKTKMDAVKSAIQAGDYNAWVVAEKAVDANSPQLTRVTADNFSKFAAQEMERESQQAEMQNKMDAVKSALLAGDYDAWVKAVKAINENSPTLQKINSENFGKYVDAFKLRDQSESIMRELGVDGLDMGDFGKSFGRGMAGGPGRGHFGGMDLDNTSAKQ
jgi:hypothetical protein